MAAIQDLKTNETIKKLSEALKDAITIPEWANFVKTGHGKTKRPESKDWYRMRAASILRKVYLNGPIGTSKLKKVYTHKKNRGHKPEKTTLASGKIIRTILQQLEKAGYVLKEEKNVHKGRKISPKGKSLVDKIKK